MKFLTLLLFCLSFVSPSFAQDENDVATRSDIDMIDLPTASTLDHYGFNFKTRLYSGGGMGLNLDFGVHERLSLGASIITDGLIGNASPIKMRSPEINVKFRVFDGGYYLPALALGYSGQGYFYDEDDKKYLEDERGLFIVGSKEVLFPALFVHSGLNISDFDDNKVFGFLGLMYTVEERLGLMAEYDNLFHSDKQDRFNVGARLYVASKLNVDLSVRELGKSGHYKNGAKRSAERIIQIRYITTF